MGVTPWKIFASEAAKDKMEREKVIELELYQWIQSVSLVVMVKPIEKEGGMGAEEMPRVT